MSDNFICLIMSDNFICLIMSDNFMCLIMSDNLLRVGYMAVKDILIFADDIISINRGQY